MFLSSFIAPYSEFRMDIRTVGSCRHLRLFALWVFFDVSGTTLARGAPGVIAVSDTLVSFLKVGSLSTVICSHCLI